MKCPKCGYDSWERFSCCEYCSKVIDDEDDPAVGGRCDHGFDFCSTGCLFAFEIRFQNLDKSCCMPESRKEKE